MPVRGQMWLHPTGTALDWACAECLPDSCYLLFRKIELKRLTRGNFVVPWLRAAMVNRESVPSAALSAGGRIGGSVPRG